MLRTRVLATLAVFAVAAGWGLHSVQPEAVVPEPVVAVAEPVDLGTGMAGVTVDSAEVPEPAPMPEPARQGTEAGELIQSGEASYYGRELAGNPTASGERFDPNGLTAAHRTLPLGSRLRVTNSSTGESVIVRVNDRGPFTGHRVLDVSERAARELGMLRAGTARVDLELLPRKRG